MRPELRGDVAGYCREFSLLPPAVPVAETSPPWERTAFAPVGAEKNPSRVFPAQAGNQFSLKNLDSRLCGNDRSGFTQLFPKPPQPAVPAPAR